MDLEGVGWVAGIATGGVVGAARRFPMLAWCALLPLGYALALGSVGQAAVAGALAGALASGSTVARKEFRALIPLSVVPTALVGAMASAAGSLAVNTAGVATLPLVLSLVTVALFLPLRLLGAPRWVSNPLVCSQEPFLTMVHMARLGSDFIPTMCLALPASIVALRVAVFVGSPHRAREPWGVSACLAAVATLGLLALAYRLRRRAETRPAKSSLRVAAVVADGPSSSSPSVEGLGFLQSPAYRDVENVVLRYGPRVADAARKGAEMVVLPEVAISVGHDSREAWQSAVATWARDLGIVLVAPFFDHDVPINALLVADASGKVVRYEKQHPALGLEPPRRQRFSPGPHTVESRNRPITLSTVICVDLDYGDFVGPVRRGGGILAAPSNDWFGGFERLHHRSAVWSAVLTGVPVVRATGHGISSVYDGAGRLLAEQSSAEGPVVLIVDVPLS